MIQWCWLVEFTPKIIALEMADWRNRKGFCHVLWKLRPGTILYFIVNFHGPSSTHFQILFPAKSLKLSCRVTINNFLYNLFNAWFGWTPLLRLKIFISLGFRYLRNNDVPESDREKSALEETLKPRWNSAAPSISVRKIVNRRSGVKWEISFKDPVGLLRVETLWSTTAFLLSKYA